MTNQLQDEWTDTIMTFAKWKSFITLTFSDKDRTHDVTRDEAKFMWGRLVQVLNKRLYGNHYIHRVGHSYFSYVLAFEYQTRGTLHMHALVDRCVDWQYIHTYWKMVSGFAWIDKVEDVQASSRYLAKYVSKGGEIEPFQNTGYRPPAFVPSWYIEN